MATKIFKSFSPSARKRKKFLKDQVFKLRKEGSTFVNNERTPSKLSEFNRLAARNPDAILCVPELWAYMTIGDVASMLENYTGPVYPRGQLRVKNYLELKYLYRVSLLREALSWTETRTIGLYPILDEILKRYQPLAFEEALNSRWVYTVFARAETPVDLKDASALIAVEKSKVDIPRTSSAFEFRVLIAAFDKLNLASYSDDYYLFNSRDLPVSLFGNFNAAVFETDDLSSTLKLVKLVLDGKMANTDAKADPSVILEAFEAAKKTVEALA